MSDESKIQIPIADFAAFKPEPGTVLVIKVPNYLKPDELPAIRERLLERLSPLGVAEILVINGDIEIEAMPAGSMQKLGWVRAKVMEGCGNG